MPNNLSSSSGSIEISLEGIVYFTLTKAKVFPVRRSLLGRPDSVRGNTRSAVRSCWPHISRSRAVAARVAHIHEVAGSSPVYAMSVTTVIIARASRPGKFKVLPPRSKTQSHIAHGRASKKTYYPPDGQGGNNSPEVRKMIATDYCKTPWSTSELARLHGCAAPRAKVKQNEIDRIIVEQLSVDFVAKRTRADQAANSIRCTVARMHRLFEGDRAGMMRHVATLIKVANDREVERAMRAANKRFPAPTPSRQHKVIGRLTA